MVTKGLGASNTIVHRLHLRVREVPGRVRWSWLSGSFVVVLDDYCLLLVFWKDLVEELDSPRVPHALGVHLLQRLEGSFVGSGQHALHELLAMLGSMVGVCLLDCELLLLELLEIWRLLLCELVVAVLLLERSLLLRRPLGRLVGTQGGWLVWTRRGWLGLMLLLLMLLLCLRW